MKKLMCCSSLRENSNLVDEERYESRHIHHKLDQDLILPPAIPRSDQHAYHLQPSNAASKSNLRSPHHMNEVVQIS